MMTGMQYAGLIALAVTLVWAPGAQCAPHARPMTTITHDEIVDYIWPGQPVPYSLLIRDGWFFIAYYGTDRFLRVAWRYGTSDPWQYQQLPEQVEWDAHNRVVLGMDEAGCIHLSANMHAVALNYYRTEEPFDPTTFVQITTLVDAEAERRVTYPVFFNLDDGTLIFRFRLGVSGNSVIYFYAYDAASRTWTMLSGGPWLSGEGVRGVYPSFGPVPRADGLWFAGYLWREDNPVETAHDVCATYTRDFISWQYSNGVEAAVPLTLANSEIVAPVPAGSGLAGSGAAWDQSGRPLVTYLCRDNAGQSQIHVARLQRGRWVSRQLSHFASDDVQSGPLAPYGNALHSLRFRNGGAWQVRLYTQGLIPLARIRPLFPAGFEDTTLPRLSINFIGEGGWGRPGPEVALERGATTWLLRWETLPNNGGRPQDVVPGPQPLRLIQVTAPAW